MVSWLMTPPHGPGDLLGRPAGCQSLEHGAAQGGVALIASDAALQQWITISQTLPGIGRRTAITLAGLMPELGQLQRRQAASQAALAPHPRDSGTP